jgi:hypothetical protein
LLILPGVALVLIASAALLLGGVSRRAAPAVAVIIGTVLIIVPLAVSIPSKTRALEHFTAALRPVFSTATSDQAARYLTVTQRMNNQLQSEMIPALAKALHRTPAQVDGLLVSRYPEFTTGVSQLDGIVVRTRALVRLVRTNINNFDQTASIPLSSWAATTTVWLFLIPGLLLVVFGTALIAGIGLERKTSPSPKLPASSVASR